MQVNKGCGLAAWGLCLVLSLQVVNAFAAGKIDVNHKRMASKEKSEKEMYIGIDGLGEWNKMGEEDGIKLFYADVRGSSFEGFKAEMVVKSDLKTLVAMLQDTDKMPEWMYSTKSITLLEKISETESVRYLVNEIPYPLMRDRDITVHVKIEQSDDNVVSVRMIKKPGIKAEVRGLVRIPRLDTLVRFTPLSDEEVKAEYIGHIEPGGIIQPFIFNIMLKQTPLNTMKDFRRVLKNDYQKSDYNSTAHVKAAS